MSYLFYFMTAALLFLLASFSLLFLRSAIACSKSMNADLPFVATFAYNSVSSFYFLFAFALAIALTTILLIIDEVLI